MWKIHWNIASAPNFNQLNFDIEKFAVFSWQICGFSSCADCQHCANSAAASSNNIPEIFMVFLFGFFIAGKNHKQNNVNGAFFYRMCDCAMVFVM